MRTLAQIDRLIEKLLAERAKMTATTPLDECLEVEDDLAAYRAERAQVIEATEKIDL